MTALHRHGGTALLLAGLTAAVTPRTSPAQARAPGPQFDLVIAGGRVMDPETGLDAVRHVGIRGGRIAAIATTPLVGRDTIDARGHVVAPGFIDLHQHSFSTDALQRKAQDGVTAAFEMELGVPDISDWYGALEGRSPIHFGATVGHPGVRMLVLTDSSSTIPAGEGATRAATEAEIAEMRSWLERELTDGALGVGLAIGYTPGATVWEVLEMFNAAGRFAGAPVHVHVRDTDRPQFWVETAELFFASVVSGAPLQIVHANSSFGRDAVKLFAMIDSARARGLDITTETYPYIASMTRIETTPFDDWESWDDARFQRFIWPPTGERLTRESFGRYRRVGGVVVIEGMSEDRLLATLQSPLPMIVSDGVDEESGAHPRATGTYARILGRYVREQQALTLMDALRKMTLLPAQRLERRAPAMRNKGRIRVGADADLTVFDPAKVIDRATYTEPLLPSTGIAHVLVGGVPVVRNAAPLPARLPGRGIRGGQP